ncbi:hypothetical protein DV736_g5176, partial [Chaetothyriales sp. CBS 134916]
MYPTYEKLASLYASNSTSSDKVTIAKVDWEANEIPGDIRGFPTFLLFPAGSKDAPIGYDGPWTVKDFASFIRDNGKHKVDVLLETDHLKSNLRKAHGKKPPNQRNNPGDVATVLDVAQTTEIDNETVEWDCQEYVLDMLEILEKACVVDDDEETYKDAKKELKKKRGAVV